MLRAVDAGGRWKLDEAGQGYEWRFGNAMLIRRAGQGVQRSLAAVGLAGMCLS